jgi:hypothetical protein
MVVRRSCGLSRELREAAHFVATLWLMWFLLHDVAWQPGWEMGPAIIAFIFIQMRIQYSHSVFVLCIRVLHVHLRQVVRNGGALRKR